MIFGAGLNIVASNMRWFVSISTRMQPLRSYVVASEYRYETSPTSPCQELQVEPCDLTKRLASLEAAAAPIERGAPAG